jgi:CRISPR-associated endonuclease/helicase Cas3
VVLAKSTPINEPETLYVHTLNVLEETRSLKESYGTKILQSVPDDYRQYFWDALFLACKTHDLGKAQTPFQNKILKALKRSKSELFPVAEGVSEVAHNIVSPAFLHNYVKAFPEKIRPTIYQAVAFHHSRGKELLLKDSSWIVVDNIVKKDISKRLGELQDMQTLFDEGPLVPSSNYLRELQTRLDKDQTRFYLLLKGLLHRADHAGSAHLAVEVDPNKHSSKQVVAYLLGEKEVDPESIWQSSYAAPVLDRNVVLQAGTGSGKTEFALFWIGNEKAFYTLPMRTSVNAMYERLKKTYSSQNIGLLHSDSAIYALSSLDRSGGDVDSGISDALQRIDASRQLSMPISVCTADQMFTAAFRYEGYEKIFATLAYSRLIVDEIQSYDPDMVAVILKTLADIADLGCKFCIITATLPKMYLDYLMKKIPGIENLRPGFRTSGRHRVKAIPKAIDDPEIIDLIVSLNKKYGGVLVIANTVKMATKIKTRLQEMKVSAHLLHSMFTYEDREFKEQFGILKCQKGIWITTQLAEVSLDIDFNVMVTEISSIDSQVQRWGRVWRNRKQEYTSDDPNIYVTTIPSDNGHIYDKNLVSLTEHILCINNLSLLSDKNEFDLIQSVFGDPILEESDYKSKFDKSIKLLEDYNFSVETKMDAQRLFRRIFNVSVIPSEIYDISQKEIDQAIAKLATKSSDRVSRLTSLQTIRRKMVSIPYYYFKDINSWSLDEDHDVIIANMKYTFENGVELTPVPSAAFI